MSESDENLNPKVTSACNEAIAKLDKVIKEERGEHQNVRNHINKKKREIVVEFAERLEQLIPQTDTISSTIIKQLKGRVGKSLIHKFLPAKYKQEYRRKNAFKQNKKIRNKINLAPIVALNRQEYSEVEAKEEEKQKKEVIMVDADGRSITQKKEGEESTENESEDHNYYSRKDETFNKSSSSKQQQQIEQNNPFEEIFDHQDTHSKIIIYNGLADISHENSDKPLEEQHQLTINANKFAIVSGSNFASISDSNILNFKVFRSFKYIQECLNELISKFGYYSQVCFKCSIDKRNGKVLNFEIEGQNQKQSVSDENIGLD